MKQILKQLLPGETFACFIFNRLTDKQLQKQRERIEKKEKSQNRTYSEKSKMIAGLIMNKGDAIYRVAAINTVKVV